MSFTQPEVPYRLTTSWAPPPVMNTWLFLSSDIAQAFLYGLTQSIYHWAWVTYEASCFSLKLPMDPVTT